MFKYKGYIIEHENNFGKDMYYVYEPKDWEMINKFQNHPLCDVKKYIDKRIKEQKKHEEILC